MTMKHTHDYKVVDVFTARPLAGNPVAVVFDADGLSTEAMQAVAGWTNLSETTFVLTPIFTCDLHAALDAAKALEAGGVMINDSSDYRFDAMPFGGFKYGSLGREGVRFAYEEMTQPKVVCIRRTARPA